MSIRGTEVHHGKGHTGEDDPETEGVRTVGKRDNPVAEGLEDQCDGHVPCRRRERGLLGGRRGDARPRGLRAALPRARARRTRLSRPRMGPRAPRARPRRRHAQEAPCRVPRRGGRQGRAGDVLRPLLQALPGVRGADPGGGPRRAQGGSHHGGRLGGTDDAARRPRHGRGVEGLPVRGLPAPRPDVLRRADAGHEAGYMAAMPRARLRLFRRVRPPA